MTKNIRLSKKGFFPVSLYRAGKGEGSWAEHFNVMPRTVKDGTSGQLHKKKNKRKNWGNFEKNVKLSSNFRKCKFKEIKKFNSYITTYVQKSTRPPEEI